MIAIHGMALLSIKFFNKIKLNINEKYNIY